MSTFIELKFKLQYIYSLTLPKSHIHRILPSTSVVIAFQLEYVFVILPTCMNGLRILYFYKRLQKKIKKNKISRSKWTLYNSPRPIHLLVKMPSRKWCIATPGWTGTPSCYNQRSFLAKSLSSSFGDISTNVGTKSSVEILNTYIP